MRLLQAQARWDESANGDQILAAPPFSIAARFFATSGLPGAFNKHQILLARPFFVAEKLVHRADCSCLGR